MESLKKEIISILTKCGLSINNSYVSNGYVFTLTDAKNGCVLQFSFATDKEFTFALSKIETCIQDYGYSTTKEMIKQNDIKLFIQEV